MAVACCRPCVESYQGKVGKNFDGFAGKLDQIEDFAECITAISAIVMLCLPKFSTSPILTNITAAIGGAGAVTTLLLFTYKLEGIVTGKMCLKQKEDGTLSKKPAAPISLLVRVSSLVARVASTALVLNAFGVFSLGAHRAWVTTTMIASLSTLFVALVLETATDKKDCTNEKKVKLTGRVLQSLAIPGLFGFVPASCPLPIRVSALAVTAVAFAFNFSRECYSFEKPTKVPTKSV